MKRLDLAGKVRGRLTIISYSHSHVQPSKQKRAIWNAICECGKKVLISTANFTSGNTVSCGCYMDELRRKGTRKRTPLSDLKAFFVTYRCRAKNIKKEFNLTLEDFCEMVVKNCYFCNGEPLQKFTKLGKKRKVKYNGIDRLDNNLGYTLDNCVPCCGICNMMKNELSLESFKHHIKLIYDFYIKEEKCL